MRYEDYLKIFEDTACKQTYRMADGVKAVVDAVIDHTHDVVIDGCESDDECRQEIINYSMRLTGKASN